MCNQSKDQKKNDFEYTEVYLTAGMVLPLKTYNDYLIKWLLDVYLESMWVEEPQAKRKAS